MVPSFFGAGVPYRLVKEALGANVDLSRLNWIVTANDIGALGQGAFSFCAYVSKSCVEALWKQEGASAKTSVHDDRPLSGVFFVFRTRFPLTPDAPSNDASAAFIEPNAQFAKCF